MKESLFIAAVYARHPHGLDVYAVGPEQIRRKLGLMERLYGKALK